jgi:hypothetical protein
MKEPTQSGFEAWKKANLSKWPDPGERGEPRMAWIYLCHLFNTTGAVLSDRCCADKKCRDPEDVQSCRDRKSPEERESIERIEALVKEFVHNGNSFRPQNRDRIMLVLEDLQLPRRDGEIS